jgi:hypothetical protein
MANFNVNIFGTTHRGSGITPPKGYVLFNLHILQLESDISVCSYDMFFILFDANALHLSSLFIPIAQKYYKRRCLTSNWSNNDSANVQTVLQ